MAQDKLTGKQSAFVASYMIHLNICRAAKEAGYSCEKYGWELMRRPDIKQEIKKRSEEFMKGKEFLKARVIQELCNIAFSNLEDIGRFGPSGFDIKNPEEIPDSAKRAIMEFSVNETDKAVNAKVRLHNKTAALDLLSKYLGMNKEQHTTFNIAPYIIEKINGDSVELGVKTIEGEIE